MARRPGSRVWRKCRSSSASRPISKFSSCRSSKICSARTSIRSRKRRPTHDSRMNLGCVRKISRRKSVGAAPRWRIRCGCSTCIEQVQTWLTQGLFPSVMPKCCSALKEPEEQRAVAETILRRSATVRATERLVARQLGGTRPRRRQQAAVIATSATIDDLQNRFQEHLGTRVTLHHGEKRGRIEIEYYGNDDLQRVLSALGLPSSES